MSTIEVPCWPVPHASDDSARFLYVGSPEPVAGQSKKTQRERRGYGCGGGLTPGGFADTLHVEQAHPTAGGVATGGTDPHLRLKPTTYPPLVALVSFNYTRSAVGRAGTCSRAPRRRGAPTQ